MTMNKALSRDHISSSQATIDLIDLLFFFWKKKIFIAIGVSCGVIFSSIYSIYSTPVFRKTTFYAQSKLETTEQSLEQDDVVLKLSEIINSFQGSGAIYDSLISDSEKIKAIFAKKNIDRGIFSSWFISTKIKTPSPGLSVASIGNNEYAFTLFLPIKTGEEKIGINLVNAINTMVDNHNSSSQAQVLKVKQAKYADAKNSYEESIKNIEKGAYDDKIQQIEIEMTSSVINLAMTLKNQGHEKFISLLRSEQEKDIVRKLSSDFSVLYGVAFNTNALSKEKLDEMHARQKKLMSMHDIHSHKRDLNTNSLSIYQKSYLDALEEISKPINYSAFNLPKFKLNQENYASMVKGNNIETKVVNRLRPVVLATTFSFIAILLFLIFLFIKSRFYDDLFNIEVKENK
ncbi:MAG: Wzz/FepE/Etk N-terminal domain-containing protein [Oligoflexales bacterium]